jgi:hypothetical protein
MMTSYALTAKYARSRDRTGTTAIKVNTYRRSALKLDKSFERFLTIDIVSFAGALSFKFNLL